MLNNWTDIDTQKQAMLNRLLSEASPTDETDTTTETDTDETDTTETDVTFEWTVQNQFDGGFCMNAIHVINTGDADIKDWKLHFELIDAKVTQSRNGSITTAGDSLIVTPPDWGQKINSGQAVETFGLRVNKYRCFASD